MLLTFCTLPACSDSDDAEDEIPTDDVTTLNVETSATLVNDQAELAPRVTNYRAPQTRATVATRASLPTFEMPRQPAIPTDAVALESIINASNDNAYTTDGGVYYVAEGSSVSYNGILLRNCDIYLAGTLKTGLGWKSSDDINCRIFILPTGVLNLDGSIPAYVSVYNYGTLNEVSISQKELIVIGSLYSIHDMDFGTKDVYVKYGGTVYIDGALTSGNNRVEGGSTLYVGCESKFKSLYCGGEGTTFCLRGSLELTDDNFCTDLSSRAILASGSSIKAAKKLQFLTPDVANVEIDGDNYVFLEAPVLQSISTDMRAILPGRFALKCDEYKKVNKNDEGKVVSYTNDLDLDDFLLYGSTIANEEDLTESTLVWPEGCEALLNTKPIYKLEQIASIKADSVHAHDISATCITESDGKIYVSWHQRGAGYQGCLEVAEVTSTGCTLLQALTTEASAVKQNGGRDYNHIMVDPLAARLYAVGNENKGGFIAYNDLDANGLIANNELKYRRLWGGDGNAIIRTGDYLQVASTYGLEVYTASDLTRVKRTELPGRAKYIASDGARIVTLGLETNATTTSSFVDKDQVALEQTTASLNQFATTDYLLESPTALTSGFVIAPVDGKNVVAIDGDDLYVACGAAGIVRYGNNPASFAIPTASDNHIKGYANCVAVDDQYVYVAYGAAGVYVLDKETLSVVTKYTNVGGKSANFVLVKDGKIYVAYGENGWEVLELVTI
jgi:hypothetical protein